MRNHVWTEDEDAALKLAYSTGERLSLVAARLGKTKNQIIGRARRIGLSVSGSQLTAMQRIREDLNHEQSQRMLNYYADNPGHREKVWGWSSGNSRLPRRSKPL